jgi:hypothetical protein
MKQKLKIEKKHKVPGDKQIRKVKENPLEKEQDPFDFGGIPKRDLKKNL